MAKALGVDAAYFLSSAGERSYGILWEPIGVCQRGRVFPRERHKGHDRLRTQSRVAACSFLQLAQRVPRNCHQNR